MRYSFHTKDRLCFVMEYVNGGEVGCLFYVYAYRYCDINSCICDLMQSSHKKSLHCNKSLVLIVALQELEFNNLLI